MAATGVLPPRSGCSGGTDNPGLYCTASRLTPMRDIMLKLKDCNTEHLEKFLSVITERYAIHLKKMAGEPAPWTKDEILQSYYFCNVFREDDRTTIWFRENIRDLVRDNAAASIRAIAAFRSFNRVDPTGEALKDMLVADAWDAEKVLEIMGTLPRPHVTGAYMVPSRPGKPKTEALIEVIDTIAQDASALAEKIVNGKTTQEGLWKVLNRYPGVGPFVGYEFITDMTHTCLLDKAPDLMTWAAPGPGCTRGLSRVMKGVHFHYSDTTQVNWPEMLGIMREILELVNSGKTIWPKEYPRWTMREVEHSLCEYSKYCTAKEGGRMKRVYNATGVASTTKRGRGRKAKKSNTPGADLSDTII